MQTDDEEKITLDMKAFQTLASDTRIGIIKSLDQRRKTLTELSRAFGLSASTVKEHMDKLVEAELVRLVDDGHKWKYYELTRRGTHILHPGTTKIWLMLSIAALGAFYAAWDLLKAAPTMLSGAGVDLADKGRSMLAATEGATAQGAAEAVKGASDAINACPSTAALPAQIPLPSVAMLFIFSILIGAAVVALIYTKKATKF